MPVRPRFDPSRPLIAARAFTFGGRAYAVGDPFPNPEDGPFPDRLRARQYEARAVNMGEAEAEQEDPVQMTGPKGGRYEITAPWLERPLTVRGKVNAEKALSEMREEGPPLGFIDGGSDVEVEEIGGGWYEISAPWLEEPVKEQGREAAEARQREIHEVGEPETHHGVTLTESEGGNGYYDLTADWLDEPEKVHGEEAARERAAELRQAGPPAEKPETASEGQPGAEGSQEAADQIASNAETQEAASEAAADQSGPDDAEQGDAADKADQADAGDDADAEAGKSDDPADA